MDRLRELAGEYAHIETMLDVLDASVDRLNHNRYVDSQMWQGILRFFREFFHGCHHAKVEALNVGGWNAITSGRRAVNGTRSSFWITEILSRPGRAAQPRRNRTLSGAGVKAA